MQVAPLVPDCLLGSFVLCAMAPRDGSMLMTTIKVAGQVAMSRRIVCATATNVRAWPTFLPNSGDTRVFDHATSFSCTTSSCKLFALGIQHGTLVLVFFTLSCAHTHHGHNSDNPGDFENCMEGRIRMMTAVTPAHAHAIQHVCLAQRPGSIFGSEVQAPCTQRQLSLPTQCTQQVHAKVVMSVEDGPSSPMDEPIPATEKQRQHGAPSTAHALVVVTLCLGPSLPHGLRWSKPAHQRHTRTLRHH